jgi:hypothetical protein
MKIPISFAILVVLAWWNAAGAISSSVLAGSYRGSVSGVQSASIASFSASGFSTSKKG